MLKLYLLIHIPIFLKELPIHAVMV